jgi:hypothetical protein
MLPVLSTLNYLTVQLSFLFLFLGWVLLTVLVKTGVTLQLSFLGVVSSHPLVLVMVSNGSDQ